MAAVTFLSLPTSPSSHAETQATRANAVAEDACKMATCPPEDYYYQTPDPWQLAGLKMHSSRRRGRVSAECIVASPPRWEGGALWICDGRVSPFVTRNRMRGQTPLSGRRGGSSCDRRRGGQEGTKPPECQMPDYHIARLLVSHMLHLTVFRSA